MATRLGGWSIAGAMCSCAEGAHASGPRRVCFMEMSPAPLGEEGEGELKEVSGDALKCLGHRVSSGTWSQLSPFRAV